VPFIIAFILPATLLAELDPHQPGRVGAEVLDVQSARVALVMETFAAPISDGLPSGAMVSGRASAVFSFFATKRLFLALVCIRN
jgi:hypothetical protein